MKNIEDYSTEEMQEQLAEIFTLAVKKKQLIPVLSGLLTTNELQAIFTRWQLLNSLLDGEPQREISTKLQISLGKIARGSKLLKDKEQYFHQFIEKMRESSLRKKRKKNRKALQNDH